MKIKLKLDTIHGGKVYASGTVLDIDDDRAKRLIKNGSAVAAKAKDEATASELPESPAPAEIP